MCVHVCELRGAEARNQVARDTQGGSEDNARGTAQLAVEKSVRV